MRNLFLALLFAVITFSFMITDAQAKRFGGGRSFGRQMSSASYTRNNAASTATQMGQKSALGSKWMGPLAGLAIGGLLASLFMGHGLGGGMMMWLIIGLVIFFGWRFIRSKLPSSQPLRNEIFQTQPSNVANNSFSNIFSSNPTTNTNNDATTAFDEPAFLRQTKSLFIRLQAAYDDKDLADIREFTTPQVFAEIQLQIQERGDAINKTEVINIDAQLLDLSIESQPEVASVLFSGLIREQQDTEAQPVKETWHFQKDILSSNWIVAGIQQD